MFARSRSRKAGCGFVATAAAGVLLLVAAPPPAAAAHTSTGRCDGAHVRDVAAGQQGPASDRCVGSLTVVKRVVPAGATGEDVTGAEPAGRGWTFAGATTTPGIGGLPANATTTGTGAVVYPLDYPTGTTEAAVTVTAPQHPGYRLVTPGGQNAVCESLDGGPVPVDNTGNAQNPGFTVEVPAGDAVICQVYDRAPRPAELTVDSRWTIDGVDYDHGDQPDGFAATLTLTGPGDAGPTPLGVRAARDGYRVGDTTTIAQAVTLADPACRLDRARVTSVHGRAANQPLPYTATLEQPKNAFVITNTVTCAPSTVASTPSAPQQPYNVAGEPPPTTLLATEVLGMTELLSMTDSLGTAAAVGGLLGLGGALLLAALTRRHRRR